MDTFHIMPLPHMVEMGTSYGYLIEAPLIDKPMEHYLLSDEGTRNWIIDCGLAIGKTIRPARYAEMIHEFQPTFYVVPDTWQSSKKTKEKAIRFQPLLGKTRPRAIWPLQGTTTSELLKHAQWIFNHLKEGDRIGIPYKLFPGKTPFEKAANRLRFIVRLTDIGLLAPLHFMGVWDWTEIAAAETLGVHSCDSSYCFLLTSNDNSIHGVRNVNDGLLKAMKRRCSYDRLVENVDVFETLVDPSLCL